MATLFNALMFTLLYIYSDLTLDGLEFQSGDRVVEPDPAWRAGGTTLQGYSTQQFMTAEPINVDHSKKVELVLRLVAR